MLASGVTYYPPQPAAPPAYTADPPAPTIGPSPSFTPATLLDVTVDKILGLVLQEKNRREVHLTAIRTPSGTETDESDDDAEASSTPAVYHGLRSGLSRDMSELARTSAGPTSPLARQSSKRRRNNLATPVRVRASGSPEEWPFKKELAGVLECDVCAMMLYEPVTTPCQHVSAWSKAAQSAKADRSRSAPSVYPGLWTTRPDVPCVVKICRALRSSRTTRSIACF